jgi:hypothetical protein
VDTSEVTDLHSGAPPLYSTFFVVNKNRRDAATSPTTESEYKEERKEK